jgi:hypothetical protein
MSFWKSLFGGGGGGGAKPVSAPTEAYNGFTIAPQPYPEGGQYQLAGTISKDIGGTVKTHKFVRADRFSSADDAVEFTLLKARQIIDQQGDKLFD